MTTKVKVDELVKQLVINGKKPTNIMMVYGFVGESTQKDMITLYLDPTLQSSFEVKEEDILHAVKVTKTHTVIGGTILWIQNASTYTHQNISQSQQNAERYFQGEIYEQYITRRQQEQCQEGNDISGCKCC